MSKPTVTLFCPLPYIWQGHRHMGLQWDARGRQKCSGSYMVRGACGTKGSKLNTIKPRSLVRCRRAQRWQCIIGLSAKGKLVSEE